MGGFLRVALSLWDKHQALQRSRERHLLVLATQQLLVLATQQLLLNVTVVASRARQICWTRSPLVSLHHMYTDSSRTFHLPYRVNLWANGAIHVYPVRPAALPPLCSDDLCHYWRSPATAHPIPSAWLHIPIRARRPPNYSFFACQVSICDHEPWAVLSLTGYDTPDVSDVH